MPAGCLLNSVPKAGTHLLKRVVELLPGMTATNIHLGRERLRHLGIVGVRQAGAQDSRAMMPIGVDRATRYFPRDVVRQSLVNLTAGTFATAHVPYSRNLGALLDEMHVRIICITRDPRDIVVSHAHYVSNQPPDSPFFETPLYNYYQYLSDDERIMVSIVGVRDEARRLNLLDIKTRLESVLAWRQEPFHYATTFERLVGPRGGGSRDAQLQEIRAICAHLGIVCTEQRVGEIADSLFGGTTTFRKGLIGGWREHFTEKHKAACKDLMGQMLIDLGYEKDLDW
jgi:hypothetical protein